MRAAAKRDLTLTRKEWLHVYKCEDCKDAFVEFILRSPSALLLEQPKRKAA